MERAIRIFRAGMLLSSLTAAGCLSHHRSAVADVDPRGWNDAAEVSFANADTLAPCDLWLVVRYDAAFAGEPVELEVTTVAPDSLRLSERFTLRLPVSRGPAPLLRDTGGALPAACGAAPHERVPDDDPARRTGAGDRGRGDCD